VPARGACVSRPCGPIDVVYWNTPRAGVPAESPCTPYGTAWDTIRRVAVAETRADGSTPHDILRCGPPRYYWCFPFDNRRVKHWAEHSNRKAELLHVAMMLSLQTALELMEMREAADDE
jgi:hypothetical protein